MKSESQYRIQAGFGESARKIVPVLTNAGMSSISIDDVRDFG